MNSTDFMSAMIVLFITFTVSLFIIFQVYDIYPPQVKPLVVESLPVATSHKEVWAPSGKNKQVSNLNGDGFYNKLMAMHEMKIHHTLCSNMLSITSVKMNLSLDEIIKIRSYIRVAEHRMRKYMKKAAPHPYGEVLKSIYNNYDNKKMNAS